MELIYSTLCQNPAYKYHQLCVNSTNPSPTMNNYSTPLLTVPISASASQDAHGDVNPFPAKKPMKNSWRSAIFIIGKFSLHAWKRPKDPYNRYLVFLISCLSTEF